jgi:hypothetical protein
MGGTNWSDDLYHDRAATRARTGTPTFAHDADVRSGRVATKAHTSLDPHGVKVRESRDSPAHPNSLAIGVIFDDTGSMSEVPGIVQKKLTKLMEILLDKKYCEDPHILVGAVGDAISDLVPLQLGQFEAGIEIDEQLGHIYLEANGGGGEPQESYQNVFYFFANKTSIDCWDKRGKKGFLFIIGDEKPYGASTPAEIERIFGDKVEGNQKTKDLVRAALERYHVFYLMPKGTNHYKEPGIVEAWNKLIGPENVIMLDDPNLVCETIGSTIGMVENALTLDKVTDDLGGGKDAMVVRAALDRLAPAIAAKGSVPASVKSDKTTRL